MEILNPTLDFFRKEISQCDHEQHVQRHSRQGNEQTFDPKTQEIEFVNEDEVKSHNENTMRRDESIQVEEDKPGMQIANLEEVGYASGPENLEHTTEPFINTKLIGKKRPRRRNKRSDGDDPVIRKKNVITKCEHTDQKYYAKGMCVNCYFKSSCLAGSIESSGNKVERIHCLNLIGAKKQCFFQFFLGITCQFI